MIARLRHLALFLVILSVASAAAGKAQHPTIILMISNDGQGCLSRFKSVVHLPNDFDAAVKMLHARYPHAKIHIRSAADTRWECVGGPMTALARAGFKDIGFVAQPPPADGQ